ELHLRHGGPERRHAEPRLRRSSGAALLRGIAAPEMAVDEIQKIRGADQLHRSQTNEKCRENRRDGPKRKGSEDPVTKRLALLWFREPEDQDGEDHGIVGAQQPFERDKR